jgi:hypothetical protein
VTEIEICTAALNALGTEGITTFEDDTNEARACNAFYAIVRDKVLEERVWSFAKRQYSLAPDAVAPIFGWSKRFAIPGEVVRVHRVDDGSGEYRALWDLQGRFILADMDMAFVTAVVRETDTTLYSPGFSLAVALRLAAVLSVPLKENRQLKADLLAEYKYELKEAAGADGAQGKSERIRSDWLSRSR